MTLGYCKYQVQKTQTNHVIKYGPERFLKCVEQAISLVEFKVKMLKQSLNLDNINDKIKFLNQVAKILSNVTNSIERELYVEKIANEYNVSKEAIYGEVNKLIYAKNTGEKTLEKPIVKKEIKKKHFLQGIITLIFSQVLIKLLGLLYTLYLTNRSGFGDRGNGIVAAGYQIYAMLLTISSIGVPNAISKLVSERVALRRP